MLISCFLSFRSLSISPRRRRARLQKKKLELSYKQSGFRGEFIKKIMHLSPQSLDLLANIVSSKSQISLSAHFSLRVAQNKNRRARFSRYCVGVLTWFEIKQNTLISYRKNITNISFLLAVFDFKSTTKVLSILFYFYFVHSSIYMYIHVYVGALTRRQSYRRFHIRIFYDSITSSSHIVVNRSILSDGRGLTREQWRHSMLKLNIYASLRWQQHGNSLVFSSTQKK